MDVLEAVHARLRQAHPELLSEIELLIESVRIEYGGDTSYIRKAKGIRRTTVKALSLNTREMARSHSITRRTAQRWKGNVV